MTSPDFNYGQMTDFNEFKRLTYESWSKLDIQNALEDCLLSSNLTFSLLWVKDSIGNQADDAVTC